MLFAYASGSDGLSSQLRFRLFFEPVKLGREGRSMSDVRSRLPDDSWIFHLDEESHPTASLVLGIRDAVAEEEASGEHRIGQGAILYHRGLRSNFLLTLADSIRTGDDLGRFHLQHRLGRTFFGLHGSFILVRTSVEEARPEAVALAVSA